MNVRFLIQMALPAAAVAASILFGVPQALDLAEDVTGYDIRGRKRRAATGYAKAASKRTLPAAAEIAGEEVIAAAMKSRLNRVGRQNFQGTSPEVGMMGAMDVRKRLEEKHARSLAAVDSAQQLPLSLQDLATRAGLQ